MLEIYLLYGITITLKYLFWLKNKIILSLCTAVFILDAITFPENQ